MPEIRGFTHVYKPPTDGNTLVIMALHGTGGDENDLVPFVEQIDPTVGILSPRGKVDENGHARFFRRLKEGVFDEEDIAVRSKELVQFVNDAAETYHFDRKNLIWLGYSNGANITTSVMLLHPAVIHRAILLRPMVTIVPESIPTLTDTEILISSGRQDPIVPEENTQRLIHIYQQTGAIVELFLHEGGHHLESKDAEVAQQWYLKQQKKLK